MSLTVTCSAAPSAAVQSAPAHATCCAISPAGAVLRCRLRTPIPARLMRDIRIRIPRVLRCESESAVKSWLGADSRRMALKSHRSSFRHTLRTTRILYNGYRSWTSTGSLSQEQQSRRRSDEDSRRPPLVARWLWSWISNVSTRIFSVQARLQRGGSH